MPATDARPDRLLFLKKFLSQGKRIASIAPSSRALAEAMCEHVTPNQPQTIVELGAGDGAVTRVIAERMHADSQLAAMELDADLADRLARRVPAATVIQDDVAKVATQLEARGMSQVDLVISGLPTPSLPRAVNESVFDWLASLGRAARVSQLTVMPWVFLPLYRRLFEEVRFTPVMRNLPPGGAYHCRGVKADYAEHLPGK